MTAGRTSPFAVGSNFRDTDRLLALLAANALFEDLPESELRWLTGHLTTVDLAADEILFREGERSGDFFIIIQGNVQVIKSLGTLEESLLGVRGCGEVIGEMGRLNPDGLRTATVRASEPSRFLDIPFAEFDVLLSRNPTLAYRLAGVLSARLTRGENDKVRVLREKNEQLERALAELKLAQAELIEKHRLERELELAKEIQQSILPAELPSVPSHEFGALMVPARAVGGDFFGVFGLDEGHIALLVGDVMGKGIPAAIFMAQTQALFRATARAGDSPAQTLEHVNRLLLMMNGASLFVTAIYGVLDLASGLLRYARAGHEVPLVLGADGTAAFAAQGEGTPLGILEDPVFDENRLSLAPGECLLLYSDGVTDATSAAGEFFNREGLLAAAAACSTLNAQSTCQSILHAVTQFSRGCPQADDITLLAIRRPATA